MMNENERKECISIIVWQFFLHLFHYHWIASEWKKDVRQRYEKKIVNAISLSSDDDDDDER